MLRPLMASSWYPVFRRCSLVRGVSATAFVELFTTHAGGGEHGIHLPQGVCRAVAVASSWTECSRPPGIVSSSLGRRQHWARYRGFEVSCRHPGVSRCVQALAPGLVYDRATLVAWYHWSTILVLTDAPWRHAVCRASIFQRYIARR